MRRKQHKGSGAKRDGGRKSGEEETVKCFTNRNRILKKKEVFGGGCTAQFGGTGAKRHCIEK